MKTTTTKQNVLQNKFKVYIILLSYYILGNHSLASKSDSKRTQSIKPFEIDSLQFIFAPYVRRHVTGDNFHQYWQIKINTNLQLPRIVLKLDILCGK